MKLTIIGKPYGNGVSQFLIRDAVRFYMDLLMKVDLERMNSISIEVKIIPNLAKDTKNDAMCGWIDNRHRPNQFFMHVDADLSYKGMLIATGHEGTHVKQMAMGERQEAWDGQTMRWYGIPYDVNNVHYYDLPWEIEAHGREYGLYDRFVQSLRNVELPPAAIIDPERRLRVA
jgi:hypothetical protein